MADIIYFSIDQRLLYCITTGTFLVNKWHEEINCSQITGMASLSLTGDIKSDSRIYFDMYCY